MRHHITTIWTNICTCDFPITDQLVYAGRRGNRNDLNYFHMSIL
jgi:hypothetical protein